MSDHELTTGTIAIIGAGSIGVAFAIVFARAGFQVRVQDPDPARRAAVPDELARRLGDLQHHGLIEEMPDVIMARVTVVATAEEAVINALLVQECAPEQLALKRALFAELNRLAPADPILASSSSALQPSAFADGLPGRGRCLVGHPGNPPYLIPVIEVVNASSPLRRRPPVPSRSIGQAGLCRSVSIRKWKASSSTGYRAPCCARLIAWCATVWPRSRISTGLFAMGWGCDGL